MMQIISNGVLVTLDDTETAAFYAAMQPNTSAPEYLAAYAAAKRYAVECAGTTWNGHSVQTDRESQAKMIAEFVALSSGLRSDPSPWKFGNGFVSVTNSEMQSVILAARTHVQTAFAIEASVLTGIGNGTITTAAQIDAADWP